VCSPLVRVLRLGADVIDPDAYYQVGDWHDVFYRPATVTAGKIYFSVDQHTGKAVLHCHILEHEDKGCMAFVDITGTHGATTGLLGTALVSTSIASPPPTATLIPQATSAAADVSHSMVTTLLAVLTSALVFAQVSNRRC